MVFSSLSLSFMALTFLKYTAHLFGRMYPSLGFSDISSWSDSGCAVLAGTLVPSRCRAEGKLEGGLDAGAAASVRLPVGQKQLSAGADSVHWFSLCPAFQNPLRCWHLSSASGPSFPVDLVSLP